MDVNKGLDEDVMEFGYVHSCTTLSSHNRNIGPESTCKSKNDIYNYCKDFGISQEFDNKKENNKWCNINSAKSLCGDRVQKNPSARNSKEKDQIFIDPN